MVERFSGEWKEAKLGEIGTFIKGANLSKADISVSGTPLILYGELYTTYKEVAHEVYRRTRKTVNSKHYSRVGDVIMPTSGETAEDISSATCVMIPGVILAGDLCIFRTNKLDGRFLSFALNHIVKQQIAEIAQGISIIHIRIKDLENITVRFPTLEEQHAIADTLSAFDRHISALSALIAKKQAIRQGALEDLMTGRTRLEGFCGSWKTVKLGDIGYTYGGLQGKTKADFESGTEKFITFLNVLNNTVINIHELATVNVRRNEKQHKVKVGDLFFNTSSETPEEVGMCAVLLDNPGVCYLNSFCFGLRLTREDISPLFLSYYFNSKVGRDFMRIHAQGSTRYNMSKKRFMEQSITIPPMDEQLAISSVLSALDSELSALKAERSKFSAIRQAAISDLLTGKTRLERTAH